MPKRTEHTKMPEHAKMSLPFTVRFCKNCGETAKAKELGTNNDVCPICDSRDFEEVVLTKDTKVHCVYCTKETTIEEVLKQWIDIPFLNIRTLSYYDGCKGWD